MQSSIYNLTMQNLMDDDYMRGVIYKDLTNEYYWSEDWSEEFYIKLAKRGFIAITHDSKDSLILLPELQLHYAILDFKNLHISKKVKKLMQKDEYELHFNERFDEVLQRFETQHKHNWIKGKYLELMKNLHLKRDTIDDFKVISVELISKNTQELIAGEIGYIISKTYTSLSGFSSKKHNNSGNLQLVLLAKELEKSGFTLWNLGHPHMKYKQKLGSVTYTREDFLKRWSAEILSSPIKTQSFEKPRNYS